MASLLSLLSSLWCWRWAGTRLVTRTPSSANTPAIVNMPE